MKEKDYYMFDNIYKSYKEYVKKQCKNPYKTILIILYFLLAIFGFFASSLLLSIINNIKSNRCMIIICLISIVISVISIVFICQILKNNKCDIKERQEHLKNDLCDNKLYSENGIDYLLFHCNNGEINIISKLKKVFGVLISGFLIPFILFVMDKLYDDIGIDYEILKNLIFSFKMISIIAFIVIYIIVTIILFIDYSILNRNIKNKFENDLRYLKTQI